MNGKINFSAFARQDRSLNFLAKMKFGVAEWQAVGFHPGAVRGRGGSAGEPRQALIGATVVCPDLPRIPWQHFLFQESDFSAS